MRTGQSTSPPVHAAARDRKACVVASFTADPLRAPLAAGLVARGLVFDIAFAPAGQLVQVLLRDDAGLCRDAGGINLFLLRAEDLLSRDDRRHLLAGDVSTGVLDNAAIALEGLAAALERHRQGPSAHSLLAVCPSMLEAGAPARAIQMLRTLEAGIAARLSGHAALAVLLCRDFLPAGRTDMLDPERDQIAQIPYTAAYFAELARLLALRLAALQGFEHKLVLLDADGTLWDGVCGEQEPHELRVTPGHQALQGLMQQARQRGLLLALLSKNNPEDLRRAFEQNPHMVLRLDDFVITRVNWQRKSQNVAEIAAQLNLAPDSFVLIDNDPAELAEVAGSHPGVLLLPAPADAAQWPALLSRMWMFARQTVTDEDQARSAYYAREQQRLEHRAQYADFDSFVRSLCVTVELRALQAPDLPRAAQLSARTNQFNLRKQPRSAEQLRTLLASPGIHGLLLRVQDKYGDYGVTGLVIALHEADTLVIDTLLLSCRVLGRQVELCVLGQLRRWAEAARCTQVRLPLLPNDKNAPIQTFLDQVLGAYRAGSLGADGHLHYVVPLVAWPALAAPDAVAVQDGAVQAVPEVQDAGASPPVAPQAALALTRLCELVRQQLELAGEVRAGDAYFALGGNSLKAVDLVIRARRQGLHFSLDDVITSPTLEDLARLAREDEAAPQVQSRLAPLALLTEAERRYVDDAHDLLKVDDAYPLTMLQQGMVFQSVRQRSLPVYVNVLCWTVHSGWDEPAFVKALRTLCNRHPALRTVFAVNAVDRPLQVVLKSALVPLEVVDLRALSSGAQDARLGAWVQAQQGLGVALDKAPWRLAVHRLAEDSQHLSLVIHHAVFDGWSNQSFAAELLATYRALAQRQLPQARLLPPSYALYVDLEMRALQQDGSRSYWRELLAEVAQPWWAGRQRTRDLRLRHDVPPQLCERLQARAREWAVSERSLWCTVYAALLGVLGGGRRVLGAVVTHGRPEIEAAAEALGVFLNSLPLLGDLRPAPWSDLAQGIHRSLLAQFRRRFYPAAQVQFDTGVQLGASLFNYVEFDDTTPDDGVLAASDHGDEHTDFLLTFTVNKRGGARHGTQVVLDVDEGLFPAALQRQLLPYVRRILDLLTSPSPGLWLAGDVLGPQEKQQQLLEWNQTHQPYPQRSVHGLFEDQARRQPDAIAVVDGNSQLSYGELERRANRVAQHLLERGVRSDSCVGLCVERSAEMVVGLLGILKAGAAYVPLDPAYPAARLQQMLQASGCQLILSEEHLLEELPLLAEYATLPLDAKWHQALLGRYTDRAPDLPVHPQQLAYVIFTSGSTGVPKGIAVSHRNIARLVFNRYVPYTQFGAILCAASPSFDAFTFELWGALLHGRKSVLFEFKGHTLEALGHTIAGHGVDCAWLTAALFNQVIVNDAPALGRLRWLLVGGEALSKEHIQMARRAIPQVQLVNGYGPTENTTFSCTYDIHETDTGALVSIPIGRPLDNSQAYVLSDSGQLLPAGCVGELYVGGDGLARGYVGRAALTAERFVPHPYSRTPGARLYRTGDLVRWQSDGNLEYLGRIDQQVKLRGFRIELAEIEAACKQFAGVGDAAVLVRESLTDGKEMVAYLAVGDEARTAAGQPAFLAGLQERLRQQLPAYMLPSAFVVLQALPLTRNGKLDRGALPTPQRAGLDTGATPQGETEARMAALWQDLLQRSPVGRLDNFFELGGHSLSAMRLLARVRDSFGVEPTVEDLFSDPTVAALAGWVERAQADPVPVARAPQGGSGPLKPSYAQQRLWFLDQLEGPSPTYNVPKIFGLAAEIDTETLRRALQRVVDRHDALRSAFAVHNGQPVLVDHVAREVELPVSTAHSPAQWRQLCKAESAQCFDLASGPLFSFRLVHLVFDAGAVRQCLLATFHHAVFDGLSVPVFIEELARQTLVASAQASSPPPPLPLRYTDFAQWQRERLASGALRGHEDYWRTQLADLPLSIDLPLDRPRPASLSHQGSWVEARVGAGALPGLQRLAQDEGATLYMVLLAAFAALLGRYSSQGDLAIGSPVANRTRPEFEGLIGFFVNTVVLRLRPDERASFRELVRDTRTTVLGALRHQELPFDQLVEVLKPARSLNLSPLFQVMFALQAESEQSAAGAGWIQDGDPLGDDTPEARAGVAHFDLTLQVKVSGSGLHCKLEYATDLFDGDTMRSLLECYTQVVESVAAQADHPLAALAVASQRDRQRQLVAWKQPAALFDPNRFVHELGAQQAARTPHAVALVFEGRNISLRSLNNRANCLAAELRAAGVGVEDRVGLFFERSIETVVGMLAVVKAGACYVPLDTSQAAERLLYIAGDAALAWVLCNVAVPEALGRRCKVIDVSQTLQDAGYDEATDYPDIAPASLGLRPDNLVYLLYTSGTTGRPKGVMVRHAALSNLCQDSIRRRGFNGECRNLQFAPIYFDAACAEIFNALLSGSILHIPPVPVLTDPQAFRTYSRRNGINRGYIPPAFLSVLQREDFAGYRSLSVGGEAIPQALARAWAQVCTLTNAYGPTECTIACNQGTLDGVQEVSIGRFIAHVHGYVLTDSLQLAPVGVAGELCVGGICLARGYANDARLTALKFVPDPHSGLPGARLYRTGDLVRYRQDGRLEFIGRKDQQVKLRGYRIELGDVEARMAKHPQIQAAVASVQGVDAERRLVLHYVAKPGASVPIDAAELRAFAQQGLPAYMVPSAFAALDVFPLTANGKLDRKALPSARQDPGAQAAAPVLAAGEQALAAIWGQVLGVDGIGRHDNFFERGGHSLLATQLVARVRERLGADVAVRDLFEHQSFERFAAVVDSRRAARQAGPVAAAGANAAGHLPLSPAQQRLWFLHRFMGRSAVFNIPLALSIAGPLDRARLRSALSLVVQRHAVLRTRFVEIGGEPRQVVDAPPREVALRLEHAPDAETLRELCAREKRTAFELQADALYRFCLIETPSHDAGAGSVAADQSHVLCLTLHHSVADGASVGLFLQDLGSLYGGAALEPLPFQYTDVVAWQAQRDRAQGHSQQIEHWRGALAGLPPLLELPTDFPRPPEQSYRGATQKLHVGADTVRGMQALAHAHGATLFMTLLSAFAVLLGRYSGQRDLAIGTPISSRPWPGCERLIGLFLNTLVLRFDLDWNRPFSDLLVRTRACALDAYANQDVPFEVLVEALSPERSLAHTPLFQVSFSLLENPLHADLLPGLRLGLLDTHATDSVARYDLALTLVDSDGGMAASMEYSTDLFEAVSIERLLQHYRLLLDTLVQAPAERLAALPWLTEPERQQQLQAWNPPLASHADSSVHALFEARACAQADAIALVDGTSHLSYGELDRRADCLARELLQRGVRPDSCVGLCVERSAEMVVGLLGILKAGAAYVPMDPRFPLLRLEQMVQASGCSLVVTQLRLLDTLTLLAGCEHLALDGTQFRQLLLRPQAGAPTPAVQPQQLAYTIYTSGSTGLPKGVGVTHANLVSFVQSIEQGPRFGPDDRLLAVTTLSFDIAFLELFLPLAAGATVDIAPPDDAYDGRRLAERLSASRITCMQATPPTWKLMLDAGWQGEPGLRALVGGEALSAALAGQLVPRVDVLWNLYGPTETTIWSTMRRIDGSSIDIGRPLRNTLAYVLGDALELLPPGVAGELYLGGDGVSRGYASRPAATAERFLPDPYAQAPGQRMYRTGDRVRYRNTGCLDYLGRLDQQVKLRGHRIEPGEIEVALVRTGLVADAAVSLRGEGPHNSLLVGYVVPLPGAAGTQAGLQQALKDRLAASLPAYMVPAAIVAIERLPLTPNGKLDRKALPALVSTAISIDFVPPQTEVEQGLSLIWSEILQRERIGRHDNFFELGGHSLLMMQLASRLEEAFGVVVELKDLFNHATLMAAAARVEFLCALKASDDSLVESLSDAQVLELLDQLDGPQGRGIARSVLGLGLGERA